MGSGIRDRPDPFEAQIAIVRRNGNPRHLHWLYRRSMHVELLIAEAIRVAGRPGDQFGPQDCRVEREFLPRARASSSLAGPFSLNASVRAGFRCACRKATELALTLGRGRAPYIRIPQDPGGAGKFEASGMLLRGCARRRRARGPNMRIRLLGDAPVAAPSLSKLIVALI